MKLHAPAATVYQRTLERPLCWVARAVHGVYVNVRGNLRDLNVLKLPPGPLTI